MTGKSSFEQDIEAVGGHPLTPLANPDMTPETLKVPEENPVRDAVGAVEKADRDFTETVGNVAETVGSAVDTAVSTVTSDDVLGDLGQLAQGIIASKFLNSVTGATQGTVGQAVKAPVIEAANIVSSGKEAGSAASLPRPEESKKSAAQARFDSAVAQGGKKD